MKLFEAHFEIETPDEWVAPAVLEFLFDTTFSGVENLHACHVEETVLDDGRRIYAFDMAMESDGNLTVDRLERLIQGMNSDELGAAGVVTYDPIICEVSLGD